MGIADIFGDIAEGLTSFVPAFFAAIYEAFISLFCVVTPGSDGAADTVTGFNALGIMAIAFLVIGMVYKILPAVSGFIGRRMAARRSRKVARAK